MRRVFARAQAYSPGLPVESLSRVRQESALPYCAGRAAEALPVSASAVMAVLDTPGPVQPSLMLLAALCRGFVSSRRSVPYPHSVQNPHYPRSARWQEVAWARRSARYPLRLRSSGLQPHPAVCVSSDLPQVEARKRRVLTVPRLRHPVPRRKQVQVQSAFVPANQAQQPQVRGSGVRWQRAAE